MDLSINDVRSFHLNGFLAIPQPITTSDELNWVRESYDKIFAERKGWNSGDQFDLAGTDDNGVEALPQILNPVKYAPELANAKLVQTVESIVKQLLGSDATAGIAHAILKPAGVGAPTPWHQDEAYWDPELQYKSVSVWMPLQDTTIDRGCLWFVPGSHEWPIVTHQSIGGDTRVHGLEISDTNVCKGAIACPLPAGGITIHRNRTAHYAGANTTGEPRRALILMGGLLARPYPGKRSFPWNDVKQTARAERATASSTT